jgi:ubiquinone/menaquinone biosynthesis C-methylase UbiE
MTHIKSWKDIFENFIDDKQIQDYSYKNLLKAAGHYNSKSGGYRVNEWIKECRLIENKISLKKKDKLLEIGSGSGALLKFFSKKNKIYGVDYSVSLLSLAKKALPSGKFILCEANKINFNKSFFHAVVMQSCIQYFPNEKYFLNVIKKVSETLKKNGKLFIGEIVDEDNLINFVKYRKKKIGYRSYNLMYSGKKNKKLKFFSISRNKIIYILKKNFKNFEIYNCLKRGDEKDNYRFNLVCTKK